ncbi:hypothetical protein KSP40_PGU022695 [Platanthera guangdongensis]|uniref:Uncharacterized protein n=1 Tax=Platanthera guangdongensis TaxID=2320717 RepID=A0ABR2LYH5_9ASPA
MLEAKGVIIEDDCKNVLEFCRNSMHQATWSDANFMAQDLSFLAELNQVLIQHIPRRPTDLRIFVLHLVAVMILFGTISKEMQSRIWSAASSFSAVGSFVQLSQRREDRKKTRSKEQSALKLPSNIIL